MIAAFVWSFILAAIIAFGRRWITPLFYRAINLLCGLGLAYFGLILLTNLLQSV
jgi:threonine/homoserine/homoserine lactone efflux protein